MTAGERKRFLTRVDIGEIPAHRPELGHCWQWRGTIAWNGYGRWACTEGGRHVQGNAHRRLYVHLHGDLNRKIDLDHLCRNRKCVNPEHLEPVSRQENARRGIGGTLARARQLAKTHCKFGHPLDETNTHVRKDTGARGCIKCRSDRAKEFEARNPGRKCRARV
jgi:hypothetical protein